MDGTLSPIIEDWIKGVIASTVRHTIESLPSDSCGKLLWNEQEAAGVLGMSATALIKLRTDGLIPKPEVSRPYRYTRRQLETIAAWLPLRDLKPDGCA